LGLGQRARHHVGHAGEDGAINASARWVHPPTQPDIVAQPVRGPTQTDRFGRFDCPKWVGPLEMPLHAFSFGHNKRCRFAVPYSTWGTLKYNT
jgi:hypothetical protein